MVNYSFIAFSSANNGTVPFVFFYRTLVFLFARRLIETFDYVHQEKKKWKKKILNDSVLSLVMQRIDLGAISSLQIINFV